MVERVFRVEGMTCEHCVRAVTKALLGVPGVQSAEVELSPGTARVVYDPAQVRLEDLEAAVAEEGYTLATREASS